MADPRLGKDGILLIGANEAANITDWELAINQDALEKTSFGDGYDRTYIAGLRGPVATFNGFTDTSVAQLALMALVHSTADPTTVTAVLLTNNTTGAKEGWTGSAIPQLTFGAAADGIQTISGTLQFTGGLSTYGT